MSDIFKQRTARELEAESRRSPGARLRWLRGKQSITLGDLAEFLGTTVSEISNFEMGRSVHENTPWENPPDPPPPPIPGDAPCVCGHAHSDHLLADTSAAQCAVGGCGCDLFIPDLGMDDSTDPEVETERWARAVTEGWVNLGELFEVLPCGGPACGIRDCENSAQFVDPSGVAWCSRHRAEGLHGRPPFWVPELNEEA